MKQTNNALKFLLAQYRAVFKNAYFKGLTTAMVVTAGLAAGQAQAAALSGGVDSWSAITNAANGTTTSAADFFNGSTTGTYFNNVTISNGHNLADQAAASVLHVQGTINVNKGGSLTLSGSNSRVHGFDVFGEDTPAKFGSLISNGNIVVGLADATTAASSGELAKIQMKDVTLKSGSITTLAGAAAQKNISDASVNLKKVR